MLRRLFVDGSESVRQLSEDNVSDDQTSAENDVPGGHHLQQQRRHGEEVVRERRTESNDLRHQ